MFLYNLDHGLIFGSILASWLSNDAIYTLGNNHASNCEHHEASGD